jgi:methylmalonyl-CoA/ethylmalonyl-CoA epimerase
MTGPFMKGGSMFKKVNHIGIAVKNMDEAREFWNKMYGVETPPVITEKDMQVCMIKLGEVLIELLAPVGEGVMSKFIEKRGEGIHHICYEVENIYSEIKELAAKGMDLVDKEPREGAEGKIAFLHPKATHGVLTEICQVRK